MSSSIACIVYSCGKILVARRNPVGDMGGRWEFPGGKIEAGESDEESVVREMREEFGVHARVSGLITSAEFEHRGNPFSLKAYFVEFDHDGTEIPYVLSEHTEYKWIDAHEIKGLNFVDSDLKIYPAVLEFLKDK